jgi:hypothetical protein
LKRFTPDRNGVDKREHRKVSLFLITFFKFPMFQSVPVLNVDSSLIPTSTIWRALEEQRIQSEEDDRWLEEEERHLVRPTLDLVTSPGRGHSDTPRETPGYTFATHPCVVMLAEKFSGGVTKSRIYCNHLFFQLLQRFV